MSDLGLGIDAGGTQTRWALANAAGAIVAEGSVGGMSATQMGSTAGRDAVRGIFAMLATQVLAAGQPVRACAGLTGFDGASTQATQLLAEVLKIAPAAISMRNDVEIAYLDSFAPGEGYLVYAGTGSIAAWIDADGQFHRAGGRGVTLDDGGGGFWIAREAMRHIWRLEDEQPGVWQQSAMARAVFAQIGGSDWSLSRQFIYGQDRGAIGSLALAVASSADADPVARNILDRAGSELARIALALVGRYGARPIALGGRAAQLHPLIAQSMRAALPDELSLTQRHTLAHHAAARIALHSPH
ncbi:MULTISPECIES: N-acetylglucosamine kinase [unclassified Duganella]|uniref:N-acetylglucosamine kinase n=1 Tax=unclassified Duganella TaxID=2636909 RepID=UPI000885E014|nr:MULTISPECIES: BadF/BadG/BcrA/BcrD ATPase family protein [unclassified Duganella]SDH27295.1 BadF-type ATPase [Duganella sp. OV458]SDK40589.1 BadF-type ATPase [Duganella sp. OV510]